MFCSLFDTEFILKEKIQVFNLHQVSCTSRMNEKFNWPVVGCRCICRVKYTKSVASTFIPLVKWSSLNLWPPQRPTERKKIDMKSNNNKTNQTNNTVEIAQKTVAITQIKFVCACMRCSIAALAAHVKYVYREYCAGLRQVLLNYTFPCLFLYIISGVKNEFSAIMSFHLISVFEYYTFHSYSQGMPSTGQFL